MRIVILRKFAINVLVGWSYSSLSVVYVG
uniref:Uncharacterized protein n=1 Tax=Arundo donax TaxID=35708 RepID=A0A0A9BX17_ARUDO